MKEGEGEEGGGREGGRNMVNFEQEPVFCPSCT